MTTHPPTTWTARTLQSLRRLTWITLGLLALAFGGWRISLDYVNELVRARAHDLLAQHYTQLEIGVRSARRIPGVGLELRGISVRDPDADEQVEQLVFIDEVLIRCDVRYETLWQGRIAAEQIIVRRPRVRSERNRLGQWNLAALWPLPRTPAVSAPFPTVAIEDGTLTIVDAQHATAKPILLRDVRLTVREAAATSGSVHSAPPLVCEGSCAGELFPRATFQGQFDRVSQQWLVDGGLQNLRISPELAGCLPSQLARQMQPLAALRGHSDLTFRLAGQGTDFQYAVGGRLYEGWINDASLPYSLTDLTAGFSCDRGGLKIEGATARTGVAQLQLDLIRSGFDEASPLTLRASTQQFPLDRRLPLVLPPALRELWDKFQPAGTADVVLTLTFDGLQFQPEAHIECSDLAFTYEKFPYRVHGATGSLHLKHGELDIQLQMPIGGKTTHLQGKLSVIGDKPTGWIEIQTDGPVPMDDELLAALPARNQDLLRSLHPQGMLELWGRFERSATDTEFHKKLEIHVRGGSMRYDRFPYPLDKIQGTISVLDDRWTFARLTGRNDSGHIVAEGSWDPAAADQQHLKLDLQCTDIPLHESLRGALREDVQQLWTKLQPQGTIDHLDVHLRYDRLQRKLDVEVLGQKWPPQQNIEGRSMTVRPVWFPYRLDNVTGAFHYRNGVVSLQNLQAEHGATRLKRLDGSCEHEPSGAWRMRVEKLDVEQLALDEDLLKALPPRLAQGLSRLHFRGVVSLAGQMLFQGTTQQGLVDAQWTLNVDTEDGELDCGTRFEHIRGGAEFSGAARDGSFASRGELRIDSLIFRGFHFTQIRGPLLIEPQQVTLGAWAQAAANKKGLPRAVLARVFGGDLAVDARLSLLGDNRFEVQTRMSDAELARIALDTGAAAARVSGKTFAELQLSGQTGVQESWRGQGTARLFEADIYQLPLMVALLKILNVRSPDPTAFTNGDLQFRVEGDRIYFQRIGLQGDAISLIGKGQMTLQRQLDLDFYSVMGREDAQLPFFRPLFKEAARSVLLIKVTGPLNQPSVTPHPFPELNETLQQLFPETARDAMLTPPKWSVPQNR